MCIYWISVMDDVDVAREKRLPSASKILSILKLNVIPVYTVQCDKWLQEFQSTGSSWIQKAWSTYCVQDPVLGTGYRCVQNGQHSCLQDTYVLVGAGQHFQLLYIRLLNHPHFWTVYTDLLHSPFADWVWTSTDPLTSEMSELPPDVTTIGAPVQSVQCQCPY